MDFGCASYCKYAEQCLGTLSPELLAKKEDLFKDRVAVEMKRHLKRDFKRIGHSTRMARYAEQIGKEQGGNLAVILTAAYLYNVAYKAFDLSTHGEKDETKQARMIAGDILTKLGAAEGLIKEVSDIIENCRDDNRTMESLNFKAVHDARVIADFEERRKEAHLTQKELTRLMKKAFLTSTGRRVAESVLSTSQSPPPDPH